MSHNYTITIKFGKIVAPMPDFSGCQLELYNISAIAIDFWKHKIVIEYHEKDDEASFVKHIAEFIGMMQEKSGAAEEDSYQVEAIDWDGLEDYIDEANWSDELDICPHKDNLLLSTQIKAN